MALLFNLFGAVQQIRTARTNKEKIEALNRFTEEFYRTIGILLYSRYIVLIKEESKELNQEIGLIVQDYFSNPTFDSWIRLGKLCGEELTSMGDRFALEFSAIANKELGIKERKKAKQILREIHRLRSSANFTPPRKIKYIQIIEVMRLLRNFRSHEWDDNPSLRPLINLDIDEFIISLIENLLENIKIKILSPFSKQDDVIECVEQESLYKRMIEVEPPSNDIISLNETYLNYYEDEEKFRFLTTLLSYHEESNRCYVYLKYKQDIRRAIFEIVPVIGQVDKKEIEFSHLSDIFGLNEGILQSDGLEETLIQKFGRIDISYDLIHNMPDLVTDYVTREKVEQQLLEKLSHRRLYLTTIDGGGGFGKTELAKKVVWDIITSEDRSEFPLSLQFKYVIWVSGKLEFFQDGRIDTQEQSFGTVEDLVDSILHVTGNVNQISDDLEQKKNIVCEVLNSSPSTLLLLDNLETVTERDIVWDYVIELGNTIKTEIKVLVTSRTRGGSAEQRLNVRAMELEEARSLALSEMRRFDVPEIYFKEENVDSLIKAIGSVPLLIRHSTNLLSRGYNLSEIIENLPKDSDQALNFMCNFQWSELSEDARKLLMGIAYWGGKVTFAQAKLLCGIDEKVFHNAKEQLQDHSFLIDRTLIESRLTILPPIGKYSEMKLKEYREIEEEFIENKKLLRTSYPTHSSQDLLSFTDEIALNQLFQRAELLVKRGKIDEAYQWYKQATERFPENVLAWRSRGDFEYRYFEDEQYGEDSFSKAVPLDPKDPITYTSWAYWESSKGAKLSRKLNLKRAIELLEKANDCIENDEEKLKTNDFIASSYIKLDYIAKDESNRAIRNNKRNEHIKEMRTYFRNAIHILEGNIIASPSTRNDAHHNIIDFTMLTNSYLALGTYSHGKRRKMDMNALYYLIQGLKLNNQFPGTGSTSRLFFTLGHPGILRSVKMFNIFVDRRDQKAIQKILDLESKISLRRIENYGRGN